MVTNRWSSLKTLKISLTRRKEIRTMPEPMENIRTFCNKHSPKPDARLQKLSLNHFVGKFVKIAFEADDPKVRAEHMWVKVQMADMKNDELVGVLANDPMFCDGLKNGDQVILKKELIEAVE